MGYVRAVMDYNLPLQTIASKGAVLSLDKVQNQALKPAPHLRTFPWICASN